MSAFQSAVKYLDYLLSAKTKHGIHSPFVYDLVTNVFEKKGDSNRFVLIEKLRAEMLASSKDIDVIDLGTGRSGRRKAGDIAKRSLKSKKYAQLLFRLADHFQPRTVLELGTSLGITTLYLASANKNSKVITIEGSWEVAGIARGNFEKLNAANIESVIGNFDEMLGGVVNQMPSADLVFFDGNHRRASTLNYFETCLAKAGNGSIFIFDDIRWSGEMEEAWEDIKKHPAVTVTIDLFHLGIVFFRKEQAKQDFVLKF